jgi:tetratricopeptide (TPR) repeat protein
VTVISARLQSRACRLLSAAGVIVSMLSFDVTGQGATTSETPIESQNPDGQVRILRQKLRLVDSILDRAWKRYEDQASARSQLEIASMLADLGRKDLAAGDLDNAELSLDEALRLVGELARGSRNTTTSQLRERYDQLVEGVEALRVAFVEVVREKGKEALLALDPADIDRIIQDAANEAQGGRYEIANALLASAFEQTSIALARVRAHETLEHRLVFRTPEEEYGYERDSYRSSEMLLRMAIAEKKPQQKRMKQIHSHVDAASKLEAEAQRHASRGDFVAATQRQEAAVRELTRALREAGLFIP